MPRWLAAITHQSRLGALLLSLALLGCGEREPFFIAAHGWPGYQFLFLARDEGLLPPEIGLIPTQKSTESIQLLREGRAQAAGLTLDEVLQLRAEGLDLRVVLVINVSDGADMVLGQADITAPQQLRGQRIGLESSSLAALMLRKFLSHSGLEPEEISLEYLDLEDHRQAFIERHIAALITFQPLAGQLQEIGATTLLTTREMPPLIFDVLAVRADALGPHRSDIRAAIAAHFEALAMLRGNPVDTSYRLARYLSVDGPTVMSSLRGVALPDVYRNRELFEDAALQSITDELMQLLQEIGRIQTPADTRDLFSADYLPEPM